LRCLTLGYLGNRYIVAAPPAFYLLEPLLQLSTLETVHLSFPWLLFSDDDFQRIAAAWPELYSMSFKGSIGTPNATIISLQFFAIRCPKLHSLSIPFDARRLPLTAVDDTPVSFSGLKALTTQDSPIESPLSVAQYLDRIFPNVKSIQPGSHEELWEQVGGHIKTLRMAQKTQTRDLERMQSVQS